MDGFRGHVVDNCVVLNKTLHHLIDDVLAIVKAERTKITVDQIPPHNIDEQLRTQRMEWNLSDIRVIASKRYIDTHDGILSRFHFDVLPVLSFNAGSTIECLNIIRAVGKATRVRSIEIYEAKRQSLLSNLASSHKTAALTKRDDSNESLQNSFDILKSLSQTENLLSQYRLLPEMPPHRLALALARIYRMPENAGPSPIPCDGGLPWEKRIMKKYFGRMCNDTTLHIWLQLFSEAEQLLGITAWSIVAYSHHRPWTKAEDATLLDILQRLLPTTPPSLIEWDLVATYHPLRSAVECRARAPKICQPFNKVLAKAPMLERVCEPDECAKVKPFSSSEDLQLLMAVQKYGINGGRLGTGGGIGIGSWALVATSLPSRSVLSCKARYSELCEQFQPWTYSEDRSLYSGLLQHGLSEENISDPHSVAKIERLLTNFPGRSVATLQQRYLELRKWCRLWTYFRRFTHGVTNNPITSHGPVAKGDEQQNKLSSTSLSYYYYLIHSPVIKRYIKQLEQAQVADPETEAFNVLTSWNSRSKPNSDGLADQPSCPSPLDLSSLNEDADFLQLFDALISGTLVPQTSTASVDNPDVGTLTNTSNQPDRGRLSLTDARHSKRLSFDAAEISDAAETLLQDNAKFSLFYSKVADELSIRNVLSGVNKLATLRKLAPSITDTIISRYLNSLRKSRSSDDRREPRGSESAAPARDAPHTDFSGLIHQNPLTSLKSPEKTLRLSLSMRSKFLQIRRLCLLYCRNSLYGRHPYKNPYSLSTPCWSGDMPKLVYADKILRPKRFAPAILRQLPDALATHILRNPSHTRDHCLNATKSMARAVFGINAPGSSKRKLTAAEGGPSLQLPRLLPPNYATTMGFKSLLIYLPSLIQKGNSRLSKFVEIREVLRAMPTTLSLESDEVLSDSDLRGQFTPHSLEIARNIVSPSYSRFLALGLSLFLWPGLLASISAQTFVDAGTRIWTDVYSQLPEHVKSYRPVPCKPRQQLVRAHSSDEFFSSDDEPTAAHPTPAKRSRIATDKPRVVRFSHDKHLFDENAAFSFSYNSTSSRFNSLLPREIARLYAAGFRPYSITIKR